MMNNLVINNILNNFAGFPATIQLSETSLTTTLSAQTMILLLIWTFPIIVTFAPKVTLSPICGNHDGPTRFRERTYAISVLFSYLNAVA